MADEGLNDLKTILNSLIIPNPNGLSLRQLCHEYQDLEGQMIPFRDFGFSSVTALLKSMPDRVRMVGNFEDINSVTLYPVFNSTNAHIIDMVQHQSKNKKAKRGRSRTLFHPTRFVGAHSFRPRTTTSRPFSRSFNGLNNTISQNSHFTAYRPPLLPNCVPTPIQTTPLVRNTYIPRQTINCTKPTLEPNFIEKFQNFKITRPLTNGAQNRTSRSVTDLSNIVINNGSNARPKSGNGSLPSDVKEKIRQLMLSNDLFDGIMLFNFTARYKQQFNEVLDFKKYGFDSLAECLHSVPDLIEMIPVGSNTYKLMPKKAPIQVTVEPTQTRPATPPRPVNTNGGPPEREIFNYFKSNTIPKQMMNVSPPKTEPLKMSPSNPSPTTIRTMPKLIRTVRSTSTANTTSNPIQTVTRVSSPITSSTLTSPQPTTAALVSHQSKSSPIVSTRSLMTFKVNSSSATNAMTTASAASNRDPTTTDTYASGRPDIPSSISPIPMATAADNESVRSFESAVNLNPIAKHNFRKVLTAHENGLKAVDFPDEYQRICKVLFDSRIWGFRTPMELFHGLPEIFTVEVNEKNVNILHDSRFKKFDKPKIRIDPNEIYRIPDLPHKLKAEILRLIQMNGKIGLIVDNFIQLYNFNFGSIDLHKLRVSAPIYLFKAVERELPIRIERIEDDDKVFITSEEEVREWVVSQTRAYRFIIPTIMVDTPAHTVSPGDEFPTIQLPDKFEPNNLEYVAVYISSAVNPHEFYIQFKGADYHTALEQLMFRLDFYATAPNDQWAVPYEFLYVGYPVICRYPGDRNWHRARISRLHPTNKKVVTVSFVDYGGTTVVDYSSLRLMKREFLQLPAQALKVGLYGIRPIGGHKPSDWTTTARDKLLTFSKPLYALACTLMETKDGIYWVALCDTNSQTDVFVHSVLIAGGHALLQESDDTEVDNSSNNYLLANRGVAQTNGY